MFNCVSQEKFDILKKRWEQELAAGYPNIDERIVTTLKRFNTLPGVVSVWSCSGHTYKEMELKGQSDFYKPLQDRYITFVISPDAHRVFEGFEQYLREMDRTDWGLFRPELIAQHLGWCFDTDPETGRVIVTMQTYPCWTLKIHHNNLSGKRKDRKMAQVIAEAMESAWARMIDYLVDYCGAQHDA